MAFRRTLPTFPTFSSPPPEDSIFDTTPGFLDGGSYDPYEGIKFASKTLTPLQAYKLGLEASRGKSNSSFVDKVKSGAGGLLSGALNVISRPNWAMAEGVDEATKGDHSFNVGEFLKGFKAGISGEKKTTFGDILRDRDILDGHGWARTAAGLGLDVALDPTTYLFGAGLYAKGGKFGLQAGLHGIEKKGGEHLLEGAASRTAADLSRAIEGKGILGRANPTQADLFESAADESLMNLAQRVAKSEHTLDKNKYLELRFGITKAKSIGLQTPIRLSKSNAARMEKVAKGGMLAKFHGMLAGVKPGHLDPISNDIEMGTRHLSEQLNADTWKEVEAPLRKFHDSLGDGGMKHALFAAETKGVVKNRSVDENALEAALRKEGFVGDDLVEAKAFVHQWHASMEKLSQLDEKFGVQFKHVGDGEEGIVYVPHVFDRKGREILTKSKLSHGAQTKTRKSGLSYREMVAKADSGGWRGMDVATNPIELLARRVRAGAIEQSHETLRRFVRDTYGVASHKASPGALDNAMRGVRARRARLSKLEEHIKTTTDRHGKQMATLKTRHTREMAGSRDSLRARIKEIKSRLNEDGLKPHEKASLTRELKAKQVKVRTAKAAKTIQRRHDQEASDLGSKHVDVEHELNVSRKALEHDIKTLTPKALKKAYKKNPDFAHDTLMDIASLSVKKESGRTVRYRVPADIHEAVARVEKVIADDTQMQELSRTVNKMMAEWKMLVTVVNPGYAVRNTTSDIWNAYVAGVPPWAMVKYGRQALKLMVDARKGNPQALAEIRRASHHGIMSGFFVGDVKQVARAHAGRKSKYRGFTGKATDINGFRENWGRLSHYLYRTRREKMSPVFAAQEVRRAHFDYEELTDIERKKFKAYLPFYTWTRKNVPFQLQQLASRPGRVSTYSKTAQEVEGETGVTPGEVIGHALDSHPLAFKTPFGYFDPQIGLGDLFRVTNPKNLLAMMNPALKVPIEVAQNRSMFTGQPISDDGRRAPAPGILAEIAGALGIDAGPTKRGGESGPGVNPWFAYGVSQLPFSQMLLKQNPIDRQRGGNSRLLSYLAGLSFTEVDEAEQLMILQLEARERADKATRRARDSGFLPESERSKPSYFDKEILKLLREQYGR